MVAIASHVLLRLVSVSFIFPPLPPTDIEVIGTFCCVSVLCYGIYVGLAASHALIYRHETGSGCLSRRMDVTEVQRAKGLLVQVLGSACQMTLTFWGDFR